jgi:hypothetical protein
MPGTRVRLKADLPNSAAIALIGLCLYEPYALITGKPTLSALCREHRAAEVALLTLFIAHIHVRVKAIEL